MVPLIYLLKSLEGSVLYYRFEELQNNDAFDQQKLILFYHFQNESSSKKSILTNSQIGEVKNGAHLTVN